MELQHEKEDREDQMKISPAYPLLKKKIKMKSKFIGQKIHCRSKTDPFMYGKLDYDKDNVLNLCKNYINYIYNPLGKIMMLDFYLTPYMKVKF